MLVVNALLPGHNPLGHPVVRLLGWLKLIGVGTLCDLLLLRLRVDWLITSDRDLIGLVANFVRLQWLLVWNCYLIW